MRAAALDWLIVNGAAVQFDNLAADIEAQAHPAAAVRAGLIIAAEDLVTVFRGNADSMIDYADAGALTVKGHIHLDLAAIRAKFDGIIQQVRQDLLKAQRVAGNKDGYGQIQANRMLLRVEL